ncbi:FkbM family methyltransferase [uncultured Draconibacterium sp.]|uniref:FkbM family methyltransferase n=1 Tax=uncultured Draconibacterium sp. TaxID=1573823 RepID=UPI0025D4F44D|nr:FkbM family methyltransferase [uncultured Draconibacterium sp.]
MINIERKIQNIFSRIGLTLNRQTSKKLVLKLIRRLHPKKIDKELIRLGPEKDGGYILPNDFKGINACFSPGVDNKYQFELDCLSIGMKIFLADKSVNPPEVNNKDFHFLKKYIGPYSDEDYITMDDWVNSSNANDKDLLLQMDIEGAEYASILNMSSYLLNRFRIIIIEFHGLDRLWDKEFFKFVSPVFDKLLLNHNCVHIHPNNWGRVSKIKGINIPTLMEFTFLRKDRFEDLGYVGSFPNELDKDNDPSRESVLLSKVWYRN